MLMASGQSDKQATEILSKIVGLCSLLTSFSSPPSPLSFCQLPRIPRVSITLTSKINQKIALIKGSLSFKIFY